MERHQTAWALSVPSAARQDWNCISVEPMHACLEAALLSWHPADISASRFSGPAAGSAGFDALESGVATQAFLNSGLKLLKGSSLGDKTSKMHEAAIRAAGLNKLQNHG